MPGADDPFDEVLGLEDKFYEEGYKLGISDGKTAGLSEGRLFGLEKGFEKFFTMGEMHGKATVLTARLRETNDRIENALEVQEFDTAKVLAAPSDHRRDNSRKSMTELRFLQNPRLAAHVRVLRTLTGTEDLSTVNREEDVEDFESKMKKAEAKLKIIEKITGEMDLIEADSTSSTTQTKRGDGSIEDVSSLHVRH